MLIPISYPTAGQFWTQNPDTDIFSYNNRTLTELPPDYSIPLSRTQLQTLANNYHLDLPLRLLAANKESRRHNQFLSCSVFSQCIPKESFIVVDTTKSNDIVLMACPELCFLQAASVLSFYDLLRFGYDLCSQFYLDESKPYLQGNRLPLTTAENIRNYLLHCRGASGKDIALRASKYILDNSNSPMETKLAMAMYLPFSSGGFRLKGPVLNKPIVLSEKGAEFLKKKTCTCDTAFELAKVVVEYDSHLVHLTAQQHAWDKNRATALSLSGYKVFTITAENLLSFSSFEETFLALRGALGMPLNKQRWEKWRDKRYELYSYIRKN